MKSPFALSAVFVSTMMLCSCHRLAAPENQWFHAMAALLVCHYLADFCLTTRGMIEAKTLDGSIIHILFHAAIHAVLVAAVLYVFDVPAGGCLLGSLIEFFSHFFIDTGKIFLTRYKPILKDMKRKSYWMLFGFDQLLHLLVILTLTLLYL